MTISERTLRKWRKEALKSPVKKCQLLSDHLGIAISNNEIVTMSYIEQLTNRVLRMTQELLDQHLLRK